MPWLMPPRWLLKREPASLWSPQKVEQELLDNPALEKGEDEEGMERIKEQDSSDDPEANEFDYDNINISDYLSNDDGGDRSAFHLNED